MKKIFNFSIILFIFCLSFTFGGIFNCFVDYADAAGETARTVEFGGEGAATRFKEYINTFGTDGVTNDNIVLTSDIDMSEEVLIKGLGTKETPFEGTFNGNGYKILNLTIDLRNDMTDATVVASQYAGLFGYVKGAIIENIEFAGTNEIKVGGYKIEVVNGVEVQTEVCAANNIYAGLLIGRAENTVVRNIQNVSNIKFNPVFNSNVYFGSIAGELCDSKVSNIISKNDQDLIRRAFGNWTLNRTDGKVHNLGGLVGSLSNTQVKFSCITQGLKINISDSFVGTVNVGGIAGAMNQGGSEIFNIALDNNYSINNNSQASGEVCVNVGEVAGKIMTPVPLSGNIAYIHFKNNGLSKFGDAGDYKYSGKYQENDYIVQSVLALNSLETTSKIPEYFANQVWHPLYGDWNFDTVWYVSGQSIKLQNFYGNFKINYVDNSEVLAMKIEDFQTTYRYGKPDGQSVEMEFEFKSTNDGATNLRDFYNVSAINISSQEVAKIITSSDGSALSYRVSGNDYLDIEATENGFKIVVKEVNFLTMGDYSITTVEKSFKGKVTSKLFDQEGTLKEGVPGYVYFADATNTIREELPLEAMSYGQTFKIRTREKPNTPNLFDGWYLVNQDGEDTQIVLDGSNPLNRVLEIKFGTGVFVGDFEIYARYLDNAQEVNFILDEGISRIDLYSGSETIEESGQSINVNKANSNFKMEIYVEKDYEFDLQLFIDTLNTYKAESSENQFCTLQEKNEEGELKYYNFTLDMTVLNRADFEDTFEIKAQTKKIEKNNNNWIWIAVGVGGGLLLIGIVILIVVLVRRNRFGGGMGGGSFKSYKKGTYY